MGVDGLITDRLDLARELGRRRPGPGEPRVSGVSADAVLESLETAAGRFVALDLRFVVVALALPARQSCAPLVRAPQRARGRLPGEAHLAVDGGGRVRCRRRAQRLRARPRWRGAEDRAAAPADPGLVRAHARLRRRAADRARRPDRLVADRRRAGLRPPAFAAVAADPVARRSSRATRSRWERSCSRSSLAPVLVAGPLSRRARGLWLHVEQGGAILRTPTRYVRERRHAPARRLGLPHRRRLLPARRLRPAGDRAARRCSSSSRAASRLSFRPPAAPARSRCCSSTRSSRPRSTAAALSFSVGMQVGITTVNTLIGLTAMMLMFRTLRPVAAVRAARGSTIP